jgi:uncharacterized protein YydD (DUF2326 family)
MTHCVYAALRRNEKATPVPPQADPNWENLRCPPRDSQPAKPEEEENMAQQTTMIEDSFDRIQSAFKSVEGEVQKAQKRLEKRGEKFSKDAERQVKKMRKEMRKLPIVKRAESLGNDLTKEFEGRSKRVEKQIETGIETVLGGLQIASRGEISKLDKKLNRINRRLKALDKAITDASTTTAQSAPAPTATPTQGPA